VFACHLCSSAYLCYLGPQRQTERFDPENSLSLRPTAKSFGACPSISIKLTLEATIEAGLLTMKAFASLVWLSHLDLYSTQVLVCTVRILSTVARPAFVESAGTTTPKATYSASYPSFAAQVAVERFETKGWNACTITSFLPQSFDVHGPEISGHAKLTVGIREYSVSSFQKRWSSL
jgi:hypothetical protein